MAKFVVGKPDPAPEVPVSFWLEEKTGCIELWAGRGEIKAALLSVDPGGSVSRFGLCAEKADRLGLRRSEAGYILAYHEAVGRKCPD